MNTKTMLLWVGCLLGLAQITLASSADSSINYSFLIFPDFCIPKIFSFDSECIKLTLSKFLSLGILLGSLAFKVPQILKIINNKSSKGISTKAYILDSLQISCAIIFYFSQGLPFKSYGENVSIIIQNMISKHKNFLT
jgi:uncharacterized protein with PQ loop repeat